MNEKIKELAEQAGFNPIQHGDHIVYDISTNENIKKFAELVARECMTICKETQAAYFKHRKATDDFRDKNIYAEGEAASDIIKYKIKKHFGVE
jgi:hypothetical protein